MASASWRDDNWLGLPSSVGRNGLPSRHPSAKAPLCHAAQQLGGSGLTAGHVDNGIMRLPRRLLRRAPSREWGPTQDFFPFPLGQAIESDPPHSILGTIHASNTAIDPAPLPSCRLSLFHRACKRREGDKGTRQRSAGQDRGKNQSRSKIAGQHAHKETGRGKCPAHCESKRIVLASLTRADYARVMRLCARRFACLWEEGCQPFGGKLEGTLLAQLRFRIACKRGRAALTLAAPHRDARRPIVNKSNHSGHKHKGIWCCPEFPPGWLLQVDLALHGCRTHAVTPRREELKSESSPT